MYVDQRNLEERHGTPRSHSRQAGGHASAWANQYEDAIIAPSMNGFEAADEVALPCEHEDDSHIVRGSVDAPYSVTSSQSMLSRATTELFEESEDSESPVLRSATTNTVDRATSPAASSSAASARAGAEAEHSSFGTMLALQDSGATSFGGYSSPPSPSSDTAPNLENCRKRRNNEILQHANSKKPRIDPPSVRRGTFQAKWKPSSQG